MILNGKEIRFSFTIAAASEIAPLCPEGDLNNLFSIFDDRLTRENLIRLTKVLAILSDGTLTAEEVSKLNFYQLRELETAAANAVRADSETEIETVPKNV